MIGMSRGDEEIIDDALNMLVWQRKRIETLEDALRAVAQYGDTTATQIASKALQHKF
jgi:hypothetical protein